MGNNYVIFGYHGTSKENAQNIVKTREFIIKPRDTHWIGNGAYFFRDDEKQARYWGQIQFGKSNTEVVKVIIELDEDKFLNLDSDHGMEILQSFINEMRQSGIKLISNSTNHKEVKTKMLCLACDKLLKRYPVIQKTFLSYDTRRFSGLLNLMGVTHNGVQVCVGDQQVIKECIIA